MVNQIAKQQHLIRNCLTTKVGIDIVLMHLSIKRISIKSVMNT